MVDNSICVQKLKQRGTLEWVGKFLFEYYPDYLIEDAIYSAMENIETVNTLINERQRNKIEYHKKINWYEKERTKTETDLEKFVDTYLIASRNKKEDLLELVQTNMSFITESENITILESAIEECKLHIERESINITKLEERRDSLLEFKIRCEATLDKVILNKQMEKLTEKDIADLVQKVIQESEKYKADSQFLSNVNNKLNRVEASEDSVYLQERLKSKLKTEQYIKKFCSSFLNDKHNATKPTNNTPSEKSPVGKTRESN